MHEGFSVCSTVETGGLIMRVKEIVPKPGRHTHPGRATPARGRCRFHRDHNLIEFETSESSVHYTHLECRRDLKRNVGVKRHSSEG